jgi:hypothetical protein
MAKGNRDKSGTKSNHFWFDGIQILITNFGGVGILPAHNVHRANGIGRN